MNLEQLLEFFSLSSGDLTTYAGLVVAFVGALIKLVQFVFDRIGREFKVRKQLGAWIAFVLSLLFALIYVMPWTVVGTGMLMAWLAAIVATLYIFGLSTGSYELINNWVSKFSGGVLALIEAQKLLQEASGDRGSTGPSQRKKSRKAASGK